jgi:hypothetical protein
MFELTASSINLLEVFYKNNATKQMQRAGKLEFTDNKFNVISDYEYINKYLKHERFEIVS